MAEGGIKGSRFAKVDHTPGDTPVTVSGTTSSRTSEEGNGESLVTGFRIAGVDEVGRGPLAGTVVAAAVILDPARPVAGLLDSKLLDETTRERLDEQIRRRALAFCIAESSVEEIDRLNILQASLLAMQRAVAGLSLTPHLVLVDGNRCPVLDVVSIAIVKGDQRIQSISAASIIAKVARDRQMVALHAEHPDYGFDRHKGYPTAQHRAALLRHGACICHRRSFAPVRAVLQASSPDGSAGKPS